MEDEFKNLKVADPSKGTERTEYPLNFCSRCERVTVNKGLCEKCKNQMKQIEIENVNAK